MHVFYTPDIEHSTVLPEEEAAHAVRVLRLQPGDEVMLTDGKGCFYKAEISVCDKKHCLVNILEESYPLGSSSYQEYGPHGMAGRESYRNWTG